MPNLGIIQWVVYFHVFRALLGLFELTIICDCYDYLAKIRVSLHSCVLETFIEYFESMVQIKKCLIF